MAINISTDLYENAHGRKPKGSGAWIFVREASHGYGEQTYSAPSYMTFREACAWVRKIVRREWQDARLRVGS